MVLVPLAYGFWARVLTGPTLSPLGQLATRVIAPRLSADPRLVAGPPKRFAQAMGVAFSSTALVLWYGFGLGTAASVVVALLAVAALLESAFGHLPRVHRLRVPDAGRRDPRRGVRGLRRPLDPPPGPVRHPSPDPGPRSIGHRQGPAGQDSRGGSSAAEDGQLLGTGHVVVVLPAGRVGHVLPCLDGEVGQPEGTDRSASGRGPGRKVAAQPLDRDGPRRRLRVPAPDEGDVVAGHGQDQAGGLDVTIGELVAAVTVGLESPTAARASRVRLLIG